MITVLLLVLLLEGNLQVRAHLAAGENSGAFTALCGLITLAKSQPATFPKPTELDSIINTIAAINLTVSDDNFGAKIDKDTTWDKATAEYRQTLPGWEHRHDAYAQAKKLLAGENKGAFEPWKKHKSSNEVKQQVNLIADQAFAIIEAAAGDIQNVLDTQQTIDKQNEALYGTKTENADTYKVGTAAGSNSRANVCSQTGVSHIRKPGFSFVQDALCLCATGPASDAAQGKACCEECAKDNGDATTLAPDNSDPAKWIKLAAACDKLKLNNKLNEQTVAAATAALAGQLTHKTSTQTESNNVLGSIEGTGSAGCTGNHNTNGGKCVVYKNGLTTTGDNKVNWLVALQQAAKHEKTRATSADNLQQAVLQLTALNNSLALLLHSPLMETRTKQQEAATTGSGNSTTARKEKQEEAEKYCNKLDKDTDCTANQKCAWNDKAADPKKKCTLSEEGKEKAVQKTKQGSSEQGSMFHMRTIWAL
uniref:Variant surface glycoprotein 1115 n=1 Tax=Trypanosoma brucei TaxID=5691 RepID=M4TAT4_9TRYP|nr:variant surface glycoprotein 1115 [Trypanosoma brucei]